MSPFIKNMEEARKEFKKYVDTLDTEKKREYLISLLTRFKVDISKTQRIKPSGGLIKYETREKCVKNLEGRTKKPGMFGEVPIWKAVSTEAEFETLLNRDDMPWIPRSITPKKEKAFLIKTFKEIFRKHRRGIFISIRDSKITHWIPLFKGRFSHNRGFNWENIRKDSKKRDEYLQDGCRLLDAYRKSEYNFAQYYDMFTQVCRSGEVSDWDVFINLGVTPLNIKNEFGLFVMSPCNFKETFGLSVPSPDEWEKATGEYYALSCDPLSDKDFVKSFSKKKDYGVYRGSVTGCFDTYKAPNGEYKSTALRESQRVVLVNFLKKFRGAGLNAALQNAPDKPLLLVRDGVVHEWPTIKHPWTNLTEVQYSTDFIESVRLTLLRSGNKQEQEKAMDIIAYAGNFNWWPSIGPVPGGGEGGAGSLAGGPAYKKAMEAYYNLEYHKTILKKAKSKNSNTNSNAKALETTIKKLEDNLEELVKKAKKEKYYIHGKGGIRYPTNRGRSPGGLISKQGLTGLRKFWKQNGVGTDEERKKLLDIAKIKGVMNEEYLDHKDQSTYKFVVVYNDIPGIMDFHMKAAMGSVLLVFDNLPYTNWLMEEMKPGVHYIPVTESNFEETYLKCIKNPSSKEIRGIAKNLKTFMKKNFTTNSMIQRVKMMSDLSSYLCDQENIKAEIEQQEINAIQEAMGDWKTTTAKKTKKADKKNTKLKSKASKEWIQATYEINQAKAKILQDAWRKKLKK